MQVILLNLLDDGQIYAYNLKSLAKRDLSYIAYTKDNLEWVLICL